MPGIKSLRHLVSGAKARTVDAETGTDLDLVYLTPRLIIMAWPGSGVEVLYRNNRRHVRRFLDTKHGEHYRIFNLVPRTENTYEADEFDGRVSRYPFPDHHPPPLSMIPLFVADMTAWLGEDERNVGVVHCKAGKGRSGTMSVAYLLSLPILPNISTGAADASDGMNVTSGRAVGAPSEPFSAKSTSSSTFGAGASRRRPSVSRNASTEHDALDQRTVGSPMEAGTPTKEEAVAERLRAVFEMHTARRLKPKSPSQAQRAGAAAGHMADSRAKSGSPMRSKSGPNSPTRSPPRSRAGSLLRRPSFTLSRKNGLTPLSPASPRERKLSHDSLPSAGSSSPSHARKDLRALGVSPAGKSSDCLGLAGDSGSADVSRDRSADGHTRSGSSDDEKHVNGQANREALSPLHIPPRTSSVYCRDEERPPSSGDEDFVEPTAPHLAISIPSQRRWLGYWGRLLAGNDPRMSLYAFQPRPLKRFVRITRVWVERAGTADSSRDAMSAENLSVQLMRYDDRLADRLSAWERGARRRRAAFRLCDPGAIAPALPGADEETLEAAGLLNSTRAREKAHRREEQRWKEAAEQQARRERLAQHGNETGVGEWGIDVRAEAVRAREFWWDDDNEKDVALAAKESHGKIKKQVTSQLNYCALLREAGRERIGDAGAGPALVSYEFDCSNPTFPPSPRFVANSPYNASRSTVNLQAAASSLSLHPALGARTKSHGGLRGASEDLHAAGPRRSQSDDAGRAAAGGFTPQRQRSQTTSSHASPYANTPYSSRSPADSMRRLHSMTASDDEHGIIVDADREIGVKVLLGRTGATHAKLPDVAAACWAWLIPSFEDPYGHRPNQRRGPTEVRLSAAELDFRKSGVLAPGGDIRAIGLQWEWVETGRDSDDEDTADEPSSANTDSSLAEPADTSFGSTLTVPPRHI